MRDERGQAGIIDALDEPAVLIERERIVRANRPARELLGPWVEGANVRLAIRQPDALELILGGGDGEAEVVGIGDSDRTWLLQVRSLDGASRLVRLTDRSAMRAAERMRTDFVANASHELRTPLAAVIGFAETLAEEQPLEDELRARFARSIYGEARRMERIVEDLMSLSRIEADRFRRPSEQVDLAEIVRIAETNARRLADSKGCSIRSEVEPGIAPIAGDFAQLLQLLDNLNANALRYGCNQRSREVSIRLERQGSEVLLSVIDRGDGIAPEHLPRLTERFYRVDAARSREAGGTGLGLAIVKHIAERHRAKLEIASTPGQGTRVTVRFSAG